MPKTLPQDNLAVGHNLYVTASHCGPETLFPDNIRDFMRALSGKDSIKPEIAFPETGQGIHGSLSIEKGRIHIAASIRENNLVVGFYKEEGVSKADEMLVVDTINEFFRPESTNLTSNAPYIQQ